jgi:hypothetical protein
VPTGMELLWWLTWNFLNVNASLAIIERQIYCFSPNKALFYGRKETKPGVYFAFNVFFS